MTILLSASRLHLLCASVAMLALHSCIPEPACAATPLQLRWTAELSDPKPYNAVLFAGESADLVATLKLYGRAVALEDTATASLYWQTNGMGSAWWQSPATVTTAGVVTASWTPEMDAGADLYRWHIGVANAASSTIYRAFGSFRMQPSPGAAPNILDLPTRWIDFDLVAIINAPWATPADVAEATEGFLSVEADPVALPVATQALAHAQSAHGIAGAGGFAGGTGATVTLGGGAALGNRATTSFGGAVGANSVSVYGGAVGVGAMTSDGFAGGFQAVASSDGTTEGDPIDAIQLGQGGNAGTNTLQVYSYTMMEADGSIPMPRMSVVSNWVESIRGIYVDVATNVVYHVVVSNGHWLVREVQ